MTTIKISNLPAAATLTGNEQLPAVQTGITRRTNVSSIADYIVDSGLVAAGGPIGSSGLTMPGPRILGRVPNTTGAVQNIELGNDLTIAGAVLRNASPGRLNVKHFGAVGNGVADDTASINACIAECVSQGLVLYFPPGEYRVTSTINVSSAVAGIIMDGTLLLDTASNITCLSIGTGGSTTCARKYMRLSVARAAQSNWTSESSIGIMLRNIDECHIHILRAEGFTIGVQLRGEDRGCQNSVLMYGRITNNYVGVDLHTLNTNSWNNAIVHIGGRFANGSTVNTTLNRYGFRFSAQPGAYDRHNAHLFLGCSFELQRHGTPPTVEAIPFLVDVNDARGIRAVGIRMEECSPFVARHTGAAKDCTYETTYVGTYGFTGAQVLYDSTVTRAGGAVLPMGQATGSLNSPRLIADAGDIRRRAYRHNAADTGFEGMTVLTTNPSGPPTTLEGFCFPGGSSITLATDHVEIPTSRALAFVVDTRECKEIFLAADGTDLRAMCMQFDDSQNVLNNSSRALLDNMNVEWMGSPSFMWRSVANIDGLTSGLPLNRLPRWTVASNCRYAVVGVLGGAANAVVRSVRLYAPLLHNPPVIARTWGRRVLFHSDDWDPPNLSSGATASNNFTVTGAVPGDMVMVSATPATTLPYFANVSATNTVTVVVWNRTGSAVDMPNTTWRFNIVKPLI